MINSSSWCCKCRSGTGGVTDGRTCICNASRKIYKQWIQMSSNYKRNECIFIFKIVYSINVYKSVGSPWRISKTSMFWQQLVGSKTIHLATKHCMVAFKTIHLVAKLAPAYELLFPILPALLWKTTLGDNRLCSPTATWRKFSSTTYTLLWW